LSRRSRAKCAKKKRGNDDSEAAWKNHGMKL